MCCRHSASGTPHVRLVWVGVFSALSGFTCAAASYEAVDQFTLNPSGGGTVISNNSQAAAGQQVVGTSGTGHALLWNGSGTSIDLNPTNLFGFSTSAASGTDGFRQVGMGSGTGTGNQNHALLWNSSASSAVDLHPFNLNAFTNSYALAVNGTRQAGAGRGPGTANNYHALFWNGSAASALDLHPVNLAAFTNSFAYDVASAQQVGYGYGPAFGTSSINPSSFHEHALLWSGSADSALDLNPTNLPGFSDSYAIATSGAEQVGDGYGPATGNQRHALLWNGSADSAIDLNPANLDGFGVSVALDTNGSQQVGFGRGSGTGNFEHALVWSGSADSAVDLHSLLPPQFRSSVANTIEAAGNVFGTAVDSSGNTHAMKWTVIPEPSYLSLLPLIAAGWLLRVRVKRRI